MSVWRLNNEKLLVADVQTFPVPPARASRQRRLTRRQVQNDGREGGEKLEDRGWNLPQGTFIFHLLGRGTPKVDELEYIVNQIEDNEIITLEAPDTLPAHIFLDQKRAPLSIESYQPDQSEATGLLKLQLRFSVLGKWIADGGNYDQEIHGRFKQTDGTPTYEREDGTTQSDLTVTVDEQETGYLKAKNPSTLAWDTLSPSSTSSRTNRDGDVVITETYDLSGYLFPSDPSTTGDVGLFEIRQAPTFGTLVGVSATLTAATSLTADADVPGLAAATLTAASELDAVADLVLPGSATLTTGTDLSAIAQLLELVAASATLTAATSLSATALLFEQTPASATLTAATSLSSGSMQIHAASATLTAATSLDALAEITLHTASATLSAATSLSAQATVGALIPASATLTSATDLQASGGIIIEATATIQSFTDLDAMAAHIRTVSAILTAQTSLDASAIIIHASAATLTAATSLDSDRSLLKETTLDAFESGDLAEYQGDT